MENEKRKGSRGRLLGLIPALLLAVLAAGLLLTPKSEPDGEPADRTAEAAAPYLVEEESFFSDFTVRGDRVYFLCRLCIRNPADRPQAVRVTGDFSEDAAGGLLAGNRDLHALRMEDYTPGSFLSMSDEALAAVTDLSGDRSLRVLPLQPGDNTFWVLFAGDHGTAEVKQNRLLPPISICPLRDVTPEEVLETTGCRIFKDPDSCEFYLADGERCSVLGTGFGGYGFTSAVPWDYDGNGTVDLLYTYSWGSGMHRSHLALFDRTTKEEQALYVYYPWDYEAYGSDLLVEKVTDESGAPVFHVYTVDVQVQGHDFTDLRFTKRAEAGVVDLVRNLTKPGIQPLFCPASADFFPPPPLTVVADPPNSCEFYMADIFFTLTGEKAAELLDFCDRAMKQAEPGDFQDLDRTKPLMRLIFTWDDGARAYYAIDWKDRGSFELSYASAQGVLQFPAGTYDALLAMWGEAGDPVEEAEALFSLQSCSVTYGGGTVEVSGETAEELYQICGDARTQEEPTGYRRDRPEQRELFLCFHLRMDGVSGTTDGPYFYVYEDELCETNGSIYASYVFQLRFPAGSFDRLIDVLERDGALPVPAGERIEGNEVYALFEDKGVYAVQLYGADGELVWACGPVNHEPLVAEEEPGLWSVSVQAGTGLSTRRTLYYAPETGTLSPSYYGVLDRQGDRLIHLYFGNQLEVRGLFDTEEGVVLRHFSEPLSNAVEPFVSAHFTEDGKAVVVTYLAGEDYHEVTETIPLP